jgi:hypothetical protein
MFFIHIWICIYSEVFYFIPMYHSSLFVYLSLYIQICRLVLYICLDTYSFIQICTNIHSYILLRIFKRIYTYMYIYTYVKILYKWTIYIYVHKYRHISMCPYLSEARPLCTHTCISIHVYTYVYICGYTCKWICIHTYILICHINICKQMSLYLSEACSLRYGRHQVRLMQQVIACIPLYIYIYIYI